MARRRRRHGPPRCNTCQAPVVFFRSAVNKKWRPFDPKPVDRAGSAQRVAYPVENNAHWWHPLDLVADLVARYEKPEASARAEVDDMPWYAPHLCLTHPATQEDQLHADDRVSGPQAHDRALATTGGHR